MPLLGLALKPLLQPLVTPELYLGVLFLCVLPSTVQSSIAFVSVARGNVAAAVCSASASNLLGMFLTPLLAGLVLSSQQGAGGAVVSLDAVGKIALQLLLPFVAGQVAAALDRRLGGAPQGADEASPTRARSCSSSTPPSAPQWSRACGARCRCRCSPALLFIAAVVLAADARPHHLGRAAARLQQGRRDHDRLLRLEEDARQRRADGQGAVRRLGGRRDGAAADDLPPAAADGLRRARPALCGAAGDRAGRLKRRGAGAQGTPYCSRSQRLSGRSPQRQLQPVVRGRNDAALAGRRHCHRHILRSRRRGLLPLPGWSPLPPPLRRRMSPCSPGWRRTPGPIRRWRCCTSSASRCWSAAWCCSSCGCGASRRRCRRLLSRGSRSTPRWPGSGWRRRAAWRCSPPSRPSCSPIRRSGSSWFCSRWRAANAALFHVRGGVARLDRAARWQGLLSIGLWLAVIVCGRSIAYV